MTGKKLAETIQNLGLPATKKVETDEIPAGTVVKITFKSLDDDEGTLFCYFNAKSRLLEFCIPSVYETTEGGMIPSLVSSCYLDASHLVNFGGYRWDPDFGKVAIYGALPITEDKEDIPERWIEFAVRSMLELYLFGKLNLTEQVNLRLAVQGKVINDSEAKNILERKYDQVNKLLGNAVKSEPSNIDMMDDEEFIRV